MPVTHGISWLATFAFLSPVMKRISFVLLILESLVGLHRTSQLQLFGISVWGTDWITVLLNGFHGKWTEVLLSFLRLDPNIAFQTVLLTLRATQLFAGIFAHSSRYNYHLNKIPPFVSILVHRFQRCQCSPLTSAVWSCRIHRNKYSCFYFHNIHCGFLLNVV